MIQKRLSLALVTNFLSEVLGKIAPLIMLSLAQKRLGLEAFGMSQVAISLIESAVPFVAFGYGQYGSIKFRDIKRKSKEEGALVTDICFLRFFHGICASVCLWIFTLALPSYHIYSSSVLVLSSILFLSAIDLLWVQIATQKMAAFGILSFFSKILTLIFTFFLVVHPEDAFTYSFLSLASSGLICFLTFCYCFSSISWQKPSLTRMKQVFIASKGFSLIAIYVVFIDRVDLFVAQSFLGLEQAGIYSSILRINGTLIQLLSVLGMIFLSETLLSQSKKDLTKWVSLSLHGFLFLLFPLFIGSFFTDKQIAAFIYGADFAAPSYLLSIFIFGDLGNILTIVFGQQILQLHKRSLPVIISMLSATLLFLSLCFLFRTSLDLKQIALIQAMSKLLGAFILFAASRRFIDKLSYKQILRPLVPALIMGGCLFVFLKESDLFLKIGLGCCFYLLSYMILNKGLNTQNLTDENS